MKTEPKAGRPNYPAKDVVGTAAALDQFTRRILAVPHSKIKARLEEEKKTKQKRVSRVPAV
jgi:hypothetical protein